MLTFWNNGERETIKGIDIPGVRQLDCELIKMVTENITDHNVKEEIGNRNKYDKN